MQTAYVVCNQETVDAIRNGKERKTVITDSLNTEGRPQPGTYVFPDLETAEKFKVVYKEITDGVVCGVDIDWEKDQRMASYAGFGSVPALDVEAVIFELPSA